MCCMKSFASCSCHTSNATMARAEHQHSWPICIYTPKEAAFEALQKAFETSYSLKTPTLSPSFFLFYPKPVKQPHLKGRGCFGPSRSSFSATWPPVAQRLCPQLSGSFFAPQVVIVLVGALEMVVFRGLMGAWLFNCLQVYTWQAVVDAEMKLRAAEPVFRARPWVEGKGHSSERKCFLSVLFWVLVRSGILR